MFSRSNKAGGSKSLKPGEAGLSFIGPEVVISGDIATANQLHVDGRIDGHVRCTKLCQGPEGSVTGNIRTDEAHIAGLVEGKVVANQLTLESSARIRGDITYETISIAAGAQVDGRLARQEAMESSAAKAPPLLVATSIDRKAVSRGKAEKAAGTEEGDFFPLPEPGKAVG